MEASISPLDLARQLEIVVDSLSPDGGSKAFSLKAEEKTSLLLAASKLIDVLEPPDSRMLSVALAPCGHAAFRAACEMKLFEHFPTNAKTVTTDDLVERTGAEKLLITRIMRVLVAQAIFHESSEDTFTHSALSRRLTHPTVRTLILGLGTAFIPYLSSLPSFLSHNGFRNPTDPQYTLFNYATGTPEPYFSWLQTQPDQLTAFSATMKASTELRRPTVQKVISELFPEDASAPDSPQEVLVVDVGGGQGVILKDLRASRPDLKGRMIVQDLPKEVQKGEEAEGVEAMSYDFFTPQPVANAHTYFFRHIFHDWPDTSCRQILKHTVAAMKQGHSRIIILDAVLPNVGATLGSVLLDINMMTIGGMERTERQWRDLLESERLKIVQIREPRSGEGSDGLVEAVLA